MDAQALHQRARTSGVNPIIYRIARLVLIPFFRLYFRMDRYGMEHIPAKGGLLLAANHRSFLDPFVLGTMTKRPLYYVAKKELFRSRLTGWFLNSLGAFPVDRGASDEEMLETARAIMRRGDAVLIFPEGTRTRPGGLASPKRGVGRLALEAGVPVVPLAIMGTDDIRKGWRIRPHKVRVRAGSPLTFPQVDEPSRQLAQAVTDRIWPCVQLQWEWLGGMAPLRRAVVLGAGSWGTSIAVNLQRAGLEVTLGTRTQSQADALNATKTNAHYLPGTSLEGLTITRGADADFTDADVVFLAVPSRSLPHVLAAHGDRIPRTAGVVTLSKGLVAPLGTLPSAFASERLQARAVAALGGPAHAADALESGASVVVGSTDRAFAAQLVFALYMAGLDARATTDLTGVELAGVAKNAAALAAAAAAPAGPNAAGAAAGKVFTEIEAHARRSGARPETFSGLAGAGDLVATVVAQQSRNRRAGELLAAGVPPHEIGPTLGQAVEALDTLPLLADRLMAEKHSCHTVSGLAKVATGELPADRWLRGLTKPSATTKVAA